MGYNIEIFLSKLPLQGCQSAHPVPNQRFTILTPIMGVFFLLICLSSFAFASEEQLLDTGRIQPIFQDGEIFKVNQNSIPRPKHIC